MYGIMLNFLSLMVMIVFLLVGVAFLTLLERKLLGSVQYRKGPNKVGGGGWGQPFSDAVKLFCKESLVILKSNYYFYYFSPIMLMFLMIMNWILVPWVTNLYCMNYSVLLVFVFLSISGHVMLLVGWSSNSLYSLIGAIRFISQAVSYEVSFILIIFSLMVLGESFALVDFLMWQIYIWNMVFLFPLFLVFFVSVLAELNRSPLDLVEGESELVSGFNIEYFGSGFALIFLGEYGGIIFFSFIILILFSSVCKGGGILGVSVISGALASVVALVIFMRGVLPRVRYDELMYLCWKVVLPLVLGYLLMVMGGKFFLAGGGGRYIVVS